MSSFARDASTPGAKAVFEKFADYVPRSEKADWLAGGKNILVDRVEWVIIPDAATAAAFCSKSLYFPVPTISRDVNVRPATLH